MKHLILLVALFSILHVANNLEYKSEDDYVEDYEDAKGRSIKEYSEDSNLDDDEDEEVPEYNIKDAPKLFRGFVKSYNKKYKDEQDFKKHYRNFLSNLEFIIENNKHSGTAKQDINMFADLGDDELKNFTG